MAKAHVSPKTVIFTPPAKPWPELPGDIAIEFDRAGQARQLSVVYPEGDGRARWCCYSLTELVGYPRPDLTPDGGYALEIHLETEFMATAKHTPWSGVIRVVWILARLTHYRIRPTPRRAAKQPDPDPPDAA